jgi:putative PIN family toxin of toxin-antitoxin system
MVENRPGYSVSRSGPRKLRLVVDTNVFVSGLMGVKSAPRRIIDAWVDGRFTLVTSLLLVEEPAHVLSYPRIAERIGLSRSEVDLILAAMLSRGDVVRGELALPGVTRDPKDDAVVACAVEGHADCVVSGDEDLLVLGAYEGMEVVTPRRFLEILEEEEGTTGQD